MSTATSTAPEPETASKDAQEAPSDRQPLVAPRGIKGFQAGNKLWKNRKSADLSAAQKHRHRIQKVLASAVTTDKAKSAVAKMLEIINGDDKKAAVLAFKALFDLVGKPAAQSSDGQSPRVFAFILPGSGEIPDSAELRPRVADSRDLRPRIVANEADNGVRE